MSAHNFDYKIFCRKIAEFVITFYRKFYNIKNGQSSVEVIGVALNSINLPEAEFIIIQGLKLFC